MQGYLYLLTYIYIYTHLEQVENQTQVWAGLGWARLGWAGRWWRDAQVMVEQSTQHWSTASSCSKSKRSRAYMGSPFLPALMSTAIYYKRNTQYYYKLDNYREFVSVSLGLFPISAIVVQQSPFTYTHVKVITKRDISMGRTPVLKNVF